MLWCLLERYKKGGIKMLFQQLNRSDAEKVFIIAKNTSGGTLAANVPVFFETADQSDGLAVSQMESGAGLLFAGINHSSLADDAYGLVQVYGYRESCVVSPVVSSFAISPGSRFVGVADAGYLAYGSCVSATAKSNATLAVGLQKYVISMETLLCSTIGTATTGNAVVFIRAL
jgi:hypothetical protein